MQRNDIDAKTQQLVDRYCALRETKGTAANDEIAHITSQLADHQEAHWPILPDDWKAPAKQYAIRRYPFLFAAPTSVVDAVAQDLNSVKLK